MKNLKKILLASLVPVFCLSQAAFANGPVKIGSSANAIHTTVAKTNEAGFDGSMDLNVGQGNDKTCTKVKTVVNNDGLELKNGEVVALDGDLLAQSVGVGYTCVQEVYMSYNSPDAQPVVVQYALSYDKSTYTSAKPARQEADLTRLGAKR